MKKIISVLIFIALTVPALAQDSVAVTSLNSLITTNLANQKKIKYFFTVNTGFLGGERMKSLTYTANTVHGITLGKRLRIGAGIGIDSYGDVQTMPLFGQVSYDLLQFAKGNAVFLQASYGWAHAWIPASENSLSYSTSGGKNLGAMLGYRITAGDWKISLSAGYKFQATHSSYESPYYVNWLSTYYSPYSQVVEHDYERFTVMLGVGWH